MNRDEDLAEITEDEEMQIVERNTTRCRYCDETVILAFWKRDQLAHHVFASSGYELLIDRDRSMIRTGRYATAANTDPDYRYIRSHKCKQADIENLRQLYESYASENPDDPYLQDLKPPSR